ncbi:MAG: hypothetical protein AB1454_14785 [Candidatus Auribacterota bacterium]
MKYVNPFLLSIVFLGIILSSTTEAIDSIIKTAESDIIRFEQQAQGLTPSRRSNAQRILKLLDISHERLQTSTNQNDPSWQEVNQRYINLKKQIEEWLAPTQPEAQNTQTAIPQTGGDTTPANVSPQTNDSVPELVSGERVRVKKLARDIESVTGGLTAAGPSPLQDPDNVTAYQNQLQQFGDALTRYPQTDDPDVKTARTAYETFSQKLTAEYNRAQEQLGLLGNVQERLAVMEDNSRKYAVPMPLAIPFSETEAHAWIEAASNARTVAEHNLKELAGIAPIAYLPNNPGTPQTGSPYDANDVIRLQRNASDTLQKLEIAYSTMAEQIKNRLAQIGQELKMRYQDDPAGEKQWLFISEGAEEEAIKWYDENIAIAQSSVFLETALGRDPQEAQSMIETIEQEKKDFIKKRDTALETSILPEPKSNDKKRLEIAKEIIENQKYKFGEHGKIVLTSNEIVERERQDSEIKIDDAEVSSGGDIKMSGTETTWTYKWQEFKFAVPLKETDSDTWYIWWITAKNFSSGGSRTPLNQWVSGEAVKGNRILKKNIR